MVDWGKALETFVVGFGGVFVTLIILYVGIVTIFLGLCIGAAMPAQVFLQSSSLFIFFLGMIAFAFSTAAGLVLAKIMNLFLKDKINPLIGAAGVSAVPMAARVAQVVAREADKRNFILMHAMGPNVAGTIGTVSAAGLFPFHPDEMMLGSVSCSGR